MTLGVSESASDDEITRAYRALARKYHPDLHPGDKTAEAKMKELNSAYERIKDIRSGRAAYTPGADSSWETGEQSCGDTRYGGGQYGWYGGQYGSFDDFEEQLRRAYNRRNVRRGGMFSSPFTRIILGIVIFRFVLGLLSLLVTGFGGDGGYYYGPQPEPGYYYSAPGGAGRSAGDSV